MRSKRVAAMTPEERMLWEYIEEESSELVLRTLECVEIDGFHKSHPSEDHAVETVAMKVLSAAFIKTLALLVEKTGYPSLAMAYMQTVPMHVELIKAYTIKELRQKVGE